MVFVRSMHRVVGVRVECTGATRIGGFRVVIRALVSDNTIPRLPPPIATWTDTVVNKHGNLATVTHLKYQEKVTANQEREC